MIRKVLRAKWNSHLQSNRELPDRGDVQKSPLHAQVIAGREGALPTAVSGRVNLPLIAVPTSIGYGYGRQGVSALK